jgi:hypothetical protein
MCSHLSQPQANPVLVGWRVHHLHRYATLLDKVKVRHHRLDDTSIFWPCHPPQLQCSHSLRCGCHYRCGTLGSQYSRQSIVCPVSWLGIGCTRPLTSSTTAAATKASNVGTLSFPLRWCLQTHFDDSYIKAADRPFTAPSSLVCSCSPCGGSSTLRLHTLFFNFRSPGLVRIGWLTPISSQNSHPLPGPNQNRPILRSVAFSLADTNARSQDTPNHTHGFRTKGASSELLLSRWVG